MAEFCRQCAEELDFDQRDFERPKPDQPTEYYHLCEGCGFCITDYRGTCLGCDTGTHGDAEMIKKAQNWAVSFFENSKRNT